MRQFSRLLATLLRTIKGKGYGQAEEQNAQDSSATKPYFLRTQKRAFLKIGAGRALNGESIALQPGLTIGRAAHCHFRLADPQVSREHAQFITDGMVWRIVDQGSTNGILINGMPVTDAPLKAGDRIEIGRAVLIYEER